MSINLVYGVSKFKSMNFKFIYNYLYSDILIGEGGACI